MNERRFITLLAVFLTAVLIIPGLATAKVLHFKGHAIADGQTDVTFDVSGTTSKVKLKNGKTKRRFVAKRVSNIHVAHQIVHCYKQNGSPADPPLDVFRATIEYAFYDIPPIKVKSSGKFSGSVAQGPNHGNPVSLTSFSGRIIDRKASGGFSAKYSPGGISYGYCGNRNPEPWKAVG